MQVSTTTYPEGRVSACITPAHHKPSLDPNPSAPVPFGNESRRPIITSDYTTKEAAQILGMIGNNGKPTDAMHSLMKRHGYRINGRGDRRIRQDALDRIRGVAA